MSKKNTIKLRCPECKLSGSIYTHVKTKTRVCRHCGFSGPKSAFNYSPPKPKKLDDKAPIP